MLGLNMCTGFIRLRIDLVTGYLEYGNELLVSIKGEHLHDERSEC